MKRSSTTPGVLLGTLVLVALAGAACRRPRGGGPGGSGPWTFEGDRPGQPPAGFSFVRVGEGRPGNWAVRTVTEGAQSRAVLAQTDPEPDKKRLLLAVAEAPVPFADLTARVRCMMLAGVLDQTCGLVVRYQDEHNHYVARADARSGNVRLYRVKDGGRAQVAQWTGTVAPGVWHELRVDAIGDRFVVFFDGRPVIDAHDGALARPGRLGLWTKSDALTYFDELSVEPPPRPGADAR